MPATRVNGVELYHTAPVGEGDPLVCVHGSWSDADAWAFVVPLLADRFTVVAYDRRGHSRSERPAGQGSVHEDVDDLEQLIEALGVAPAYVAGNSYGAIVAARLAARRPDLLRGMVAHEPPMLALLGDHPELKPLVDENSRKLARVASLIAAGDHEGGARYFVDAIAIAPGAWDGAFTQPIRDRFVNNAPTFLDESRDPDQLTFDLDSIRGFPHPALVTKGSASFPAFAPIVDMLGEAIPRASVLTFEGAGHIPQATHPDLYARTVLEWADEIQD